MTARKFKTSHFINYHILGTHHLWLWVAVSIIVWVVASANEYLRQCNNIKIFGGENLAVFSHFASSVS